MPQKQKKLPFTAASYFFFDDLLGQEINRLVPLPNLSDEDGVTRLATNRLTLDVLSNRALVSDPTQVLFGGKVVVASTGALSVLAPPY